MNIAGGQGYVREKSPLGRRAAAKPGHARLACPLIGRPPNIARDLARAGGFRG